MYVNLFLNFKQKINGKIYTETITKFDDVTEIVYMKFNFFYHIFLLYWISQNDNLVYSCQFEEPCDSFSPLMKLTWGNC